VLRNPQEVIDLLVQAKVGWLLLPAFLSLHWL
jgi:hypothetical protein